MLVRFQHRSSFNTDTYHHVQRYEQGSARRRWCVAEQFFIKSNYLVLISDVNSTLLAIEYVYTLILLLINEVQLSCEQKKPCCIRPDRDITVTTSSGSALNLHRIHTKSKPDNAAATRWRESDQAYPTQRQAERMHSNQVNAGDTEFRKLRTSEKLEHRDKNVFF